MSVANLLSLWAGTLLALSLTQPITPSCIEAPVAQAALGDEQTTIGTALKGRSPRRKSVLQDGVLLAYAARRWWSAHDGGREWYLEQFLFPPDRVARAGRARRVDRTFGGFGVGNYWTRDVWRAYGTGSPEYDTPGQGPVARWYRDLSGLRLAVMELPVIGAQRGLLVSSVSRYHGQRIRVNLRDRRTEHGLRLGSTRASLTRRLGTPSHTGRVGQYDVAWYFGRPKWSSSPWQRYLAGYCSGYAFKGRRIVEIMLYCWSTEKLG